jgi:formiminoglutamase
VGAKDAPDAVRTWLYRLVALRDVQLFDLGNTLIQDTLEDTHARQQRIVRQVIADGKTLISLGGGNDVAYPDCAGLAQAAGTVLAFNIDAHLDVRTNPIRNSGTPYRMLLEEGIITPGHFFEMGYQPFAVAESHLAYLRGLGAAALSLRALRQQGLRASFENILTQREGAIFWGIDMDSVHSAEAPGVSAPTPLGMSGDELCRIAELAGRTPRTRLIEFSEINPTYDIDQRTCRLAAVAIFHFLAARTHPNEAV